MFLKDFWKLFQYFWNFTTILIAIKIYFKNKVILFHSELNLPTYLLKLYFLKYSIIKEGPKKTESISCRKTVCDRNLKNSL